MAASTIARLTAIIGLVASLLVLILVAMNVVTGVSQEYFESVHPVQEYMQLLVRDARQLNLTFTVDNLFVVSYAAFFTGLAAVLRTSAHGTILKIALGAMLAVALLDSIENHHITAMANAALNGTPLLNEEIRAQAVLSSVKFHLSCFGGLALAAVFPRVSVLGKTVVWLLAGYGFLGVLVLTSPASIVVLLALTRTALFVLAFLLSGIMLWSWAPKEQETAA
ncbi:MAG: hypothetical protein ACREDR_01110 [Blastocatellia bacterium]